MGLSIGAAPAASRAAAMRRAVVQRRARGRVDLAVVVQLDDLDAVEVRRGQRREALGQHRADGEVGGHHDARRALPAATTSARCSRESPVVPTTSTMACRRAPVRRGDDALGRGEVDDHVDGSASSSRERREDPAPRARAARARPPASRRGSPRSRRGPRPAPGPSDPLRRRWPSASWTNAYRLGFDGAILEGIQDIPSQCEQTGTRAHETQFDVRRVIVEVHDATGPRARSPAG